MANNEKTDKKAFTAEVKQKVYELLETWSGHNVPDVPEGEEAVKVDITDKTVLQGEYGNGGLGFDSLDCAEIIMTLEEYFDVVVSDEDVEKIKVVGDLIKAIVETPYHNHKAVGKKME